METIKLNIKRDKSFYGVAMPYRIIVNGKEEAHLAYGKSISFEMPKEQIVLKASMVGTSFSIYKMEKEIVLFPQQCKTNIINCTITTKSTHKLAALAMGFARAARTEIEVEYC